MSKSWPADVEEAIRSAAALEEIGGRRYAAQVLMTEACAYFQRGDDDKANTLRNLSKQFTKEGDELREVFDKKFHPKGLPGQKRKLGFGQGG